jgi:2,3-bisphosphoglycerate-independent phosphoglycerate mutase
MTLTTFSSSLVSLGAAIKAVEALDENIARLKKVVEQVGGTMVITADHGNCDQMYELDKEVLSLKHSVGGSILVKTSHTLSPVPFLLVGKDADRFILNQDVDTPSLGNLAASLLMLMGYQAPEGYLPSIIVPEGQRFN